MTKVCFEKTSKPKFWSGANTTWEILKEGVWRLGSAKVWELPPWTTQNQTSISLKSSSPFSTFNKKMSCLETRWPAYRINHHLLPQYFLFLQWSPQSPRSVCHKSLMEHASNFEVLLSRYAWSCNYTPVVILMTPLVYDSLEPYSLGQLHHGLLPFWKHHPLFYKISTPLWRNLKQCLGTVTRPGLQPTSCVASSKGHVRPSSTPQNSGSLPATSIGEKLLWLISFAMGFMMMFKIFCWHSQTLLPSVKLSPRQFGAIIVCSNVARKRKSPPTPSFGTVGLLRSPQFLKQHQLPDLPLLDLLRCRSTQLSLNLWQKPRNFAEGQIIYVFTVATQGI